MHSRILLFVWLLICYQVSSYSPEKKVEKSSSSDLILSSTRTSTTTITKKINSQQICQCLKPQSQNFFNSSWSEWKGVATGKDNIHNIPRRDPYTCKQTCSQHYCELHVRMEQTTWL